MTKRTARQGRSTPRGRAAARSPRPSRTGGPLQYKVVELSTVDEASLERALNEWTRQGWTLESVQFAMRESSKRPSMAFVFFTREGGEEGEVAADGEDARRRLMRLSEEGATAHVARGERGGPAAVAAVSPWERLRQLAEGGDDEDGAT